jgi:hypothetical protein
MALTTYTQLLSYVEGMIDRTDLTAVLPDFLTQAESKLNRTLRVREMMSATTDTMSSSTITLPSDWLAFVSLWYTASGVRYEVANVPIQEVNNADSGDTGNPNKYYIAGSTVTFHPTADSNYSVGYVYYQKLDLATDTTNWLLTSHPDIYIYAILLEAALYQKDDADVQKFMEMTKGAVLQLEKSDRDIKSGSALVMRSY